MTRFKIAAVLLAAGLGSAGCMSDYDLYDQHKGPLTPISNPSLYAVNQPVVGRTDYVLDINAAGGGVPESELVRLDDWFGSLGLSYGDRVAIEGGYFDPQARDDVAGLASRYGILLANGAPVTVGAPQPGFLRVVVSRSRATVPGCPIWEDPQVGQSARTSTNYGCSVNSNLASMIADANDLVLGQTGAIDRNGDTAAKPVKGYRDRALSGAGGSAVKSEGK